MSTSLFSLKKINPKMLKAAVYGANDGIVTTFAVVSGVAGAQLSSSIIIVLGVANMLADGFSMGISDYLGEKSEQTLRRNQDEAHDLESLGRTSIVTFIAFVIAGSFPLIPYFLEVMSVPLVIKHQFLYSIMATAIILFVVGSLRTILIKGSWLRNGLEMLIIGAIASAIAYGAGAGTKHQALSPIWQKSNNINTKLESQIASRMKRRWQSQCR
jgi:VIT1/CCC1 family predicted Fe2+/Mn2+ transporter